MTAKYYVYRNLHKACFSVKHRGRVVAHSKALIVHSAQAVVNLTGRARVLATGHTNVHAYIAGKSVSLIAGISTIFRTSSGLNLVEPSQFHPETGRGLVLLRYAPKESEAFVDMTTFQAIPKDRVFPYINVYMAGNKAILVAETTPR